MSKLGRGLIFGALAVALVAAALLWARNSFAHNPAVSLANTHWSLVSLNGQAPVASRALTLAFGDDGQLGGDSGCNSYGAHFQIRGSQIVVDQMISTLRACAEQPLNDQEAAFQKALGEATQFNLAGDRLTLKNAAGSEELVFQKQ